MKEIIFATTNQNKVREVGMMCNNPDLKLLTLKDIGLDVDIVEDGSTFEENAIIKAKTIMEMTGKIALADDSGLEVDYLNGEPGIYSARYLGEDTPYSEKNADIIRRLEGVDGRIRTCRGTIEGVIDYKEKGTNGFGYDPIVYVPEYGLTTGEMEPELKNSISHRGKALEQVKKILEEELQ